MLRRTGPVLFALSMLAASLAIVSPASADLADEYTPGPCITNAIQTTPFVDVPSGQFYTNAVGWAYLNGIVNGTDDTHYSPSAPVSRAAFAAMLHRMLCLPAPSGEAPFTDIVEGSFYETAVDWLWSNGFTTGKPGNVYDPGGNLTRGELAAFLFRVLGEPAGAPVNPFGDVDRSRFFAEPIDWLFWRGITTGTTSSTFSPVDTVTRAQVITFLYRLNIGASGLIDPADLDLGFQTVLSGLIRPLGAATHPDGGVFIIEKGGGVHYVPPAVDDSPDWGAGATEILDIAVSGGSEQGLLGVAVSPDGAFLYLSFTNLAGDSIIWEYDLVNAAVTGGPRTVIGVPQPAANHNGGHIAFGPDGYLYASFGDGGGGCDSAGPNHGQNDSTLLGSILRIDPRAGSTYVSPADNPGFGAAENWLIGVRNPWRFTFDSGTGDLWVGDVGQGSREEITRLEATAGMNAGRGANLGWPAYEGSLRTCGAPDVASTVGPTHEYQTGVAGRSVTGGVVYRGTEIVGLDGTYLYADFYETDLRAYNDTFGSGPFDYGNVLPGSGTATFFEDANGEVYTISLFTGAVAKLVQVG